MLSVVFFTRSSQYPCCSLRVALSSPARLSRQEKTLPATLVQLPLSFLAPDDDHRPCFRRTRNRSSLLAAADVGTGFVAVAHTSPLVGVAGGGADTDTDFVEFPEIRSSAESLTDSPDY